MWDVPRLKFANFSYKKLNNQHKTPGDNESEEKRLFVWGVMMMQRDMNWILVCKKLNLFLR